MIWLVLFILISAAVLYGLFFLVFKLIWLLFKSKRNVWPLILAGVSTLLLAGLLILTTYKTYQYFMQPLQPIIQAVTQRSQPVYGAQLYTAPDNEFTLILYDGMVLSDWITLPTSQILIGLDTNALLSQKNPQQPNAAFSGLALLKQPLQEGQDAPSIVNQLVEQIERIPSSKGSIELDDDPEPINVDSDNPGFLLTGTIYSDAAQEGVPAAALIATRDQYSYILFAFDNGPDASAWNTLRSFRFSAN